MERKFQLAMGTLVFLIALFTAIVPGEWAKGFAVVFSFIAVAIFIRLGIDVYGDRTKAK